jgi:transglutaminase-like putative cysteine protease
MLNGFACYSPAAALPDRQLLSTVCGLGLNTQTGEEFMLRKLTLWALLFAAFESFGFSQATRHFTFKYAFTVKDVPSGEKVRIWFPAAHSGPYQEIRIVSATGDLPVKKTHESRFGNEMYFAGTSKAKVAELHFEVVYDVVRHEHLTLGLSRPRLENASLSSKESREFLGPDKLVPITGLPAELAAKVTTNESSQLDKARAIYDYVFANMSYEKTGTGWGRGDVLYACNAKKGNCTDFHSLFIAMARSQSIPSRFEIGFQVPRDQRSAEVAGYHCWAEFFDPQNGWIPVDISEAWKHPSKKDYYFGAHDADRIQFTVGRDLKLNPPQQGEPLNYFIYPYVEVAGTAHDDVANDFSFVDAGQTEASRQTSRGGH